MKTTKPTYYRSLEELDGSPEFREFLANEFAAPFDAEPPNSPARRRFLQIMGASVALSGAAACRYKEDKLVPFTRRPEGMVPGKPRYYATSMELGGVATGLKVKSFDGRPIKIEGHPEQPSSLGAASVYHQASVLGLYDPDRSHGVVRFSGGSRMPSGWADFEAFAREHFAGLRQRGGAGLRVLAEASSSRALATLRSRFLQLYPQAKWIVFEPVLSDNELAGGTLAFGSPVRTQLKLESARLVVSLDADFLGPHFPNSLANARAFIQQRIPDRGEMSRLYVLESAVSITGSVADHRLPMRSELIKAIAVALEAELSAALPPPATILGRAQPMPKAAILEDPKVKKFFAAMLKELLEKRSWSVIVAGPQQPPEVHALVHRMNALLGNVGRTLQYSDEPERDRPNQLEALKALASEMTTREVDTLVILGGNPAYTAPADLNFETALGEVKTSIHLSTHEDETSRRVHWHLPQAHYLESWGDGLSWDGTHCITQPLILPLYEGRSSLELVSLLLGHAEDGQTLVRGEVSESERVWKRAVHDGRTLQPRLRPNQPQLKALPAFPLSERELLGAELPNGQLEVVFLPDAKLYDGRFANNAWLQELPEPITKLTWDNAALINPTTAKQLGIEDGAMVTASVNGKSIKILALHAPGQALGSVKLTLGYGRRAAGQVGGLTDEAIDPVGANTYELRSTQNYFFGGGFSLSPAAGNPVVATTQHLHAIDPIGAAGEEQRLDELVRTTTLEEFKKHPDFAKHVVHHPPLLNLWVSPVAYEGHKWGMAIDLNKCIGCNACITACQAENNIPVVGKKNVSMGREMLWLRVDRYYSGPPEDPDISFQPIPCQQCENAPCEQVCPVGATMHSEEGLNDMVYNRCIGTRYCSNNCPYKVRRFNFFNYNLDGYGTTPWHGVDDKQRVKTMVYNPEVTVRSRGVMEKCTFCVQRIQSVKIESKNARQPIVDGAIKTACQETCPTDAIVFGDLNDRKAEAAKLQALPRAYSLLGELNNRPRVQYLARVKNPNPELA